MAPHLRVNGRDLSAFIRVAHDDGLDPADSDYFEPQFSGSPAFSEGAAFVGDAVGNREMVFPLFVSAESEADLHQLVRDIDQELTRGASVEYGNSADSEITHFDLERGRLEVEYKYWIQRANRVRATLRLWTRPYGHTGTSRLIASARAFGPRRIQATGIGGDIDALGLLRVAAATSGAESENRHVVAFGVKSNAPSAYAPFIHSASWNFLATSLVTGMAVRYASQYRAFRAFQTDQYEYQHHLAQVPLPPDTYAGRYRALTDAAFSVVGGPSANPKLLVETSDPARAASYQQQAEYSLGTSSQPWAMYDLGEITVPTGLASPMQLRFSIVGASGATAVATQAHAFGGLYLIPVDESAGIMVSQLGGAVELDAISSEARVFNSNSATSVRGQQPQDLRGEAPRVPPIGSSADRRVELDVLTYTLDSSDLPRVNIEMDASLKVRERFRFLR
jgi:hypothetical protein